MNLTLLTGIRRHKARGLISTSVSRDNYVRFRSLAKKILANGLANGLVGYSNCSETGQEFFGRISMSHSVVTYRQQEVTIRESTTCVRRKIAWTWDMQWLNRSRSRY